MRLLIAATFIVFTQFAGFDMADARPSRLVILRHAEKEPKDAADSNELCAVGKLRAQGLSAQYLGKNAKAAADIFGPGKEPDAFFAMTPHTQETAAPALASWGDSKLHVFFPDDDRDQETRNAVAELAKSEFDGKTVVIIWEHHHIASKQFNDADATLWSLLHLGELSGGAALKKWPGVNYNFFWIVDYSASPPTIRKVQQTFPDPQYSAIPDNGWGDDVDSGKFAAFYHDCYVKDAE